MTKNTPTDHYRSDQPISAPEEDHFNRWPFAKRIAETVAQRRDPGSLVLGIHGVWGDGKTSVLNLMRQEFKEHANVVVVLFNPWLFGSTTELLQGFFETLADALDKSLTNKKEKIGKFLKDYGSSISAASDLAGIGINPAKIAERVGASLSAVKIGERRSRIEKILEQSGKRIVIIIDDIDRLDKGEIQAIFKLVKITAGFQCTAYILAFDAEMVAASLGEQYGTGGAAAGRSFLEKIIQVPLPLPPAGSFTLRKMIFDEINSLLQVHAIELSEEDALQFVRHFDAGFSPRLKTPRQVRRYSNALAFALPILKGEVRTVDQLLVEGVRSFYPNLYECMRRRPDIFLRYASEERNDENDAKLFDEIQSSLTGLTPREQQAAYDVIQELFPRLSGVFHDGRRFRAGYRHEWDTIWANEKRVCSEQYFQRYFHYGIPPGDVSDQRVTEFLEQISDMREDTIDAELQGLMANNADGRLIDKLLVREEPIAPEIATPIACGITRNAAHLTLGIGGTLSSLLSSHRQAAILIRRLVEKIPPGSKRNALAQTIIQTAGTLPFAFECLRKFRTYKDEPDLPRLLDTNVEKQLGEALVDRIRQALKTTPWFEVLKDDSPMLLWAWNEYGRNCEATEYLKQRFESTAEEVCRLLGFYIGVAQELATGTPHKADFERREYDAVSAIMPPEELLKYLIRVFGNSLKTPVQYPGRDMQFDERIAHQFSFIHQRVQQQSEENQTDA